MKDYTIQTRYCFTDIPKAIIQVNFHYLKEIINYHISEVKDAIAIASTLDNSVAVFKIKWK